MKKRDPLWDTWCQFCYGTTDPELTESERGRINRSLRELRSIGATPESMRQRIDWWRKNWRVQVTIRGLAYNWHSLNIPIPENIRDMDNSELIRKAVELQVSTVGKSRLQLIRELEIRSGLSTS